MWTVGGFPQTRFALWLETAGRMPNPRTLTLLNFTPHWPTRLKTGAVRSSESKVANTQLRWSRIAANGENGVFAGVRKIASSWLKKKKSFEGLARQPGGTLFDQIFSSYWKKGLGGVQSLFVEKSDGALGIIGADFCLQKAAVNVSWGHGKVNSTTLAALEAETNRMRLATPGIGIVWTLHFPPFLDMESELRLRSARDALDRANSLGVQHIFAGHLHRNQTVTYEATSVACIGSAASEYRDHYGNWIRLIELDITPAGMSISHSDFRYNHSEAAFVPAVPVPQPNVISVGAETLEPDNRIRS
jgi:hypothetical protein